MAQATLRITTNDPSSPKDISLSSLMGNEAQTASCDVDSVTPPATVAEGEHTGQTLAEANATALAAAEVARGACEWDNVEQTCPEGYTGASVPAGTVTSLVSQAAADAAANALLSCVLDEQPGDWNLNTGTGVRALVHVSSAALLLGGSFTAMQGSTRNRIGKVNGDSTLSAFNPGASGTVTGIAVDGSGNVYYCGTFGLIRCNAAGVIDVTFAPTFNVGPYDIAILQSGKIVCVGGFTTVNGVSKTAICVLETTGILDAAFTATINAQVWDVKVKADGKIVVCGQFTQVNGVARVYVAQLNADGTLDTAFNASITASGSNEVYEAVELLVGANAGKIIICGKGWTVNSLTRNRIARLSGTTGLPDAWDPNANSQVYCAVEQANGSVIVGGLFTTIGGGSHVGIARLDTSGVLDATFIAETNQLVYVVVLSPAENVCIGGDFTTINAVSQSGFAKLTPLGVLY